MEFILPTLIRLNRYCTPKWTNVCMRFHKMGQKRNDAEKSVQKIRFFVCVQLPLNTEKSFDSYHSQCETIEGIFWETPLWGHDRLHITEPKAVTSRRGENNGIQNLDHSRWEKSCVTIKFWEKRNNEFPQIPKRIKHYLLEYSAIWHSPTNIHLNALAYHTEWMAQLVLSVVMNDNHGFPSDDIHNDHIWAIRTLCSWPLMACHCGFNWILNEVWIY